MTEDQKALYDKESGTFSGPIGPRMPLINSAEVERAWDQLSAALAKSALPRNLRELAILTVAVTWRSEFEWYVHSPAAVRFGIDPSIVEAMRKGQEPAFTADDQRIVYRYATELQRTHQVSDDAYAAAWKLLGTKTLVDLTVLIGHYTSVSMTLNAHKVPIPDGVPRAF
jgi:4-carboxymuconolactone decarboxylase